MHRAWSYPLFWLAVVSCAVAQVGILRGIVTARPTRPDGERTPGRSGELAWALLPAAALALLLLFTWHSIRLS